MTTIPPGAKLFADGGFIGTTAEPVQILSTDQVRPADEVAARHIPPGHISVHIRFEAEKFIRAIEAIEKMARAQPMCIVRSEVLGAFAKALRDKRLLTLRQQAKRKGRPGWKSIRIPKRYKLEHKPLPTHDDRIDALVPSHTAVRQIMARGRMDREERIQLDQAVAYNEIPDREQ